MYDGLVCGSANWRGGKRERFPVGEGRFLLPCVGEKKSPTSCITGEKGSVSCVPVGVGKRGRVLLLVLLVRRAVFRVVL